MITNPYLSLNNSGLKLPNNKIWGINGNVYNLSIIPSISGIATSDAMIGTENYQTNLYVTPAAGTTLSGWNVTGGNIENNVFTFGNVDATIEPVFEEFFTVKIFGTNEVPVSYEFSNGQSYYNVTNEQIVNVPSNVSVNISAESVTNKTFSVDFTNNFNVTDTNWNHKSSGSKLSASLSITSTSNEQTILGVSSVRDKRFSAYCSYDMSTQSDIADDYQPSLYVLEMSSNCLQNGYLNGNNFETEISSLSNASKTTGYRNGWSRVSGWRQYGPENQTPQYMVNSVLGWTKVSSFEETVDVVLTELSPSQTKINLYIYDSYSAGGTLRRWKNGYASLNVPSSFHNIRTTNNGYGPTYCIEMGRGAGNYNPVNHSGFMCCSGILK